MASKGAEEADRQAQGMTYDLIEMGKQKGLRVTYQKREARFALRAGTITSYFSAALQRRRAPLHHGWRQDGTPALHPDNARRRWSDHPAHREHD